MRLLIISFAYPPHISPRAFRWSAVAEHLASDGHDVDVVCNWKPGLMRTEMQNGVCVHRAGTAAIESLRAWLRPGNAPRTVEPCSTEVDGVRSSGLLQRSFLARLARSIHDHTWKLIYWPDFACLWYMPGVRTARELLNGQNYDAVVSVSEPFTSHLVARRLEAAHPSVSWVVDIGDPFCFREGTPTNNHKLYRRLNYSVERGIFRRADAVAVTTRGTSEAYEALFPESASKIHVVPPLISLPKERCSAQAFWPRDGKTRLVFVGTLYRDIRNPDRLLSLFARLLETDLAGRLELHILGRVNDCQQCFDAHRQLLGKQIFLHGVVGHDAAIQAMNDADLLVNIGNDTTYQLPSKVVEYASTGNPILNLAKTRNDSSIAFFEAYPASLCLLIDAEGNGADQFDKLLGFIEHLPPRVDDTTLDKMLSPFQTESVTARYAELVTGRPAPILEDGTQEGMLAEATKEAHGHANSYLVFHFRGQAVLSVPSYPSGLRRAGINLYKAVSLRRHLFKAGLRLSNLAHLDGTVARKSPTPVPNLPDFDFDKWLEEARDAIGNSQAQAVVSFPSQPGRGRFYVQLLSTSGKVLGFTKISLDEKNDERLETEAGVIEHISSQRTRSFRVPALTSLSSFDGHRYLISEALPDSAHPAPARWGPVAKNCLDELTNGTCLFRPPEELSWWPRFLQMENVEALADAIRDAKCTETQVCRAHGDFKSWNMCVTDDVVWLFDWEDSCPDAPVMSDEVSFFIGTISRALMSNPASAAAALGKRFLAAGDDGREASLALALAFLSTTENELHVRCAQHWYNVVNWRHR